MTLSEIGREDHDALLCYTNLSECCKDRQTPENIGALGEWLSPSNGMRTIVLNRNLSSIGYFKRRGHNVVRLHHNISTIYALPTGIFTCEIPDSKNITQTIYVGIYLSEEGT